MQFSKKQIEVRKMGASINRCSGCEHYDGFNNDNVRCSIGVKATIDRGCNRFTPDTTANCYECHYNKSGAKAYDIECSKYGYISGQREKCEGYAERWG